MPLPKVVTPTFELDLISTGKTIKYRPFLVKEEKVLLIALESGNEKDILNAVKDVLKSCVLTRGIKVDDLPSFELEYLFLNIRSKSVGESVELLVTCTDDGETQVPLIVKINEVKLVVPEGHTDIIDLGGGLSMKMKYPSMQQFVENNFSVTKSGTNKDKIDRAFKSVISCIEQLYNEDEAWSHSDYTEKEWIEFLEQLDSSQFQQVEKFFETMPKLSYSTKVTNPNTNIDTDVLIEGLTNFFA
jgi:T4 bacteriophage base plate protein